MSVFHNTRVKSNLTVGGTIISGGIIDKSNAGILQIGTENATKIELSKTGAVTEIKGSISVLEGMSMTGATSISTTLLVGQSGSINASAALEIVSTTKGLLLPRMTTTQRNNISSPAAGLSVYDTTENCIYYYNGTLWSLSGNNSNLGSSIT